MLRPSRRQLVALLALALLVALPVVSWQYVYRSDEPVAAANIISGILAPIAISLAGIGGLWAYLRRDRGDVASARELSVAADQLALQLQRSWRTEAASRGVTTPATLPVPWKLADAVGQSTLTELSSEPPHGSGPQPMPDASNRALPTVGTVRDIYSLYRSLRYGRLIVLGGKGSGKTGALILLLLAAIERRQRLSEKDGTIVPVPLLLPVSGWDPSSTPLTEWVVNTLNRDHPFLSSTRYGHEAARALFDQGYLALLLDGLDEMPSRFRRLALEQLSRETAIRVVLACRTGEFKAGRPEVYFPHAAIIELDSVELETARTYLTQEQVAQDRRVWNQFADRLRSRPESSVAKALTSPLALSLARRAYRDGRDPSELLNRSSGSPTDVLRALIGTVLPSAYPDIADHDRVARFFAWIASEMTSRGTQELAWWQIRHWSYPSLPSVAAALLFGLFGGLACGLFGGVAFGIIFGATWATAAAGLAATIVRLGLKRGRPVRGIVPRLSVAISLGVLFAAAIGLANRLAAEATSISPWLLGPVFGMVSGLALGLAALHDGPLVSQVRRPRTRDVAAGISVGLVSGVGVALLVDLTAGLLVSLIGGTAFVLVRAWTHPSPEPRSQVDAVTSYVADLRGGLLFGVVAGIAVGLGLGTAVFLASGLSSAFAAGLICAIGAGLVGAATASQALALQVSGLGLAARRIGPLTPMGVLNDAYQRQVLRQVGTTFQFRHGELQEYLSLGFSGRLSLRSHLAQ